MNKQIYRLLNLNWAICLTASIIVLCSAYVLQAYLQQVYNPVLLQFWQVWRHINVVLAAIIFVLFLSSYFKMFQKKKIFYSVDSLETLRALSWQQFESLTAQIMKFLKYRVVEQGGAKADGGIDLIAYKKEFKYIIQCKQWKSTTVGVKVVREMFGVSVHEQASGVYIFTCGKFTKDAIEFAKGKRVYLINGYQICKLIQQIKENG